jgi:hypothetical protein
MGATYKGFGLLAGNKGCGLQPPTTTPVNRFYHIMTSEG